MVEGGDVCASAVLNMLDVMIIPLRITVAAIPRTSMVLFVLYVIALVNQILVYTHDLMILESGCVQVYWYIASGLPYEMKELN